MTTYGFEYDFGVDGGEVGDYTLRQIKGPGGGIPSGMIVPYGVIHGIEAFDSDGDAWVRLKLEMQDDLSAIMEFDYSTSTGIAVALAKTPSPFLLWPIEINSGYGIGQIETTGARWPVFNISTADLTKGKFRIYLECI